MTKRDILDQEHHHDLGNIPLGAAVERIRAREAQKRQLEGEIRLRQLLQNLALTCSTAPSDFEDESDECDSQLSEGLRKEYITDLDEAGYEGDSDLADDISFATVDSLELAAERLPHLIHNPRRFLRHITIPTRKGRRRTRHFGGEDRPQAEDKNAEEAEARSPLSWRFLKSKDSFMIAKERLLRERSGAHIERKHQGRTPQREKNLGCPRKPGLLLENESVPKSLPSTFGDSHTKQISFQDHTRTLPTKSVSESLLYMQALSMRRGQSIGSTTQHHMHPRSFANFSRIVRESVS